MTATERLRQLLDERGVEWASAHEWEGRTFWPNANGVNATASDWGNGLLVHAVMSPEQAVEATLGEEIVRCRDCKYNDEVINACDHPWITPLRGDCPENWIFSTVPDGFCAWGKRRDA